MARNKSQTLPAGILLLVLAASATLLGYLVLTPDDPDPAGALPGSAGNSGDALEFEFYERLRQGEVQVNAPTGQPAEPGTNEIEQLAEQLNPAAQDQLDLATDTLEQIADTIVTGLGAPVPDSVAPPEPTPAAPAAPESAAETVLAAPAPASSRGESGTVLQSGAFRQQELALSELERQQNLGLEVEIMQRPGQNGTMFLIQSGPYDSRDKLEEAEMVFRLHSIATARRSLP